jgi:phosphate transport system protein
MTELRVQFHRQMDDIEEKVVQLFALVAEGLAAATHALLTDDAETVKVLTEREVVIDIIYRDVEDLVNLQLARQAPVAADLRFLLSVLRIVPELERSHDLVVHIARYGNHSLSDDLTPRCRGLVERMGRLGSEMWQTATQAWAQRDGTAAEALDERDDELDTLHAALFAELAAGRMALPVTMDMTLVARFYERLGDHAVNVARRVTYMAGPTPATEAGSPP